ncbi:hypothetical protein GXW74_23745 [Roseomonas eburnea]|uniref:Uncharacterized protein n=1 Tax=Neoroseomonas eburnea TaxID=1346889 RepID=A0A9X9XII3_9PROT|nr:hypothetical protein [Neoroseomonas eburnea]MBR0683519.1 hypothetical protein [Neoroseomonas eburnea]
MPAPPRGEEGAVILLPMRALAFAFLLAAPALADGNEPVPRVTTDSREYCAELAERLAALPASHGEPVRSMAEEGRRLCETGHPRVGVAKLRRAIRAARVAE